MRAGLFFRHSLLPSTGQLPLSIVALHTRRSYGATIGLLEEVQAAKKNDDELARRLKKEAALDYNKRRAEYRRQVSLLRNTYAKEVAQQRAVDRANKEAMEREMTRRRLERQRLKNIRSAQSAIQQEYLRKQREKEFNEYLERMQLKRDEQNRLLMKARQLVINELEKEAPYWLTTPAEVEAAFTPEAEQLLWARPGGVLGAPNPSLDSHFWHLETHTWHMDKTYMTQRDVLLQEVEEATYEEANINSSFWTPERLEERVQLEERARLRSMVRSAGRTDLLKKQRLMIEESHTSGKAEVPKPAPVPSLKMLQNVRALEEEGAQILMADPTKFFVFENKTSEGEDQVEGNEQEIYGSYNGPTLGSPVALRDRLREAHEGYVFPNILGKPPKADTRTEREKKQQEKEERMWAAARAEALAPGANIDLAAEDQTLDDLEPDINYDEFQWDSDAEEWMKGLDPVADQAIIETPRAQRYSKEDVEWVIDRLQGKVDKLQQQMTQDVDSLRKRMATERLSHLSATQDQETEAKGDDLETAVLALSEKDLMLLSDLDDRFMKGLTPEDISTAARDISGLTEDQILAILHRDRISS